MQHNNSKIQIRNKSLTKITKGIKKDRILGVALDTGKEFHVAILFDFNGRLLSRPMPINNLRAGYEKLTTKINSVATKIKAKRIIIGIEIVSNSSENFTRQLKEDFQNLFFINPLATASNRNQKLLLGLKTDAIDAVAIGDLLIRGECYPYNLRDGVYLALKEKTVWREKKLKILVKLKNQVINTMSRVYPGLNSKFEGNKPLFASPLRTEVSKLLLDLCISPHDVIKLAPAELAEICAKGNYKIKIKQSGNIIRYFTKMLLPPKKIIPTYLETLRRDVRLLRFLENEIKQVEDEMVVLVEKTPAKILLNQIKGLSGVMIASYIGCIGDINNYKSAQKIYSYSGLTPKIQQSGMGNGTGFGIKKQGNILLRTILYKATTRVKMHEPYFRKCYERMKAKKPGKKALIAISNKLNRTIFALIKKQEAFKPPATENVERIRG